MLAGLGSLLLPHAVRASAVATVMRLLVLVRMGAACRTVEAAWRVFTVS